MSRIMTPREIAVRAAKEAALAHGSTLDEVLSGSRRLNVVRAREAAMRAVAEALPRMSLHEIARMFRVSHTTVIYAFRRMGFDHGRSVCSFVRHA